MDVEHVTTADEALASIEALLLADEARHNLALGILSTARAQPDLHPELHGWVARVGGPDAPSAEAGAPLGAPRATSATSNGCRTAW